MSINVTLGGTGTTNVSIIKGATTNVRMGERLIVQNENVLEFPTITDFPAVGASNTLYIAEDESRLYYWNGTAYVLMTGGGGGGSAEWGAIAGTLSNQTDLQNALNLKTNDADLAAVAKTGDYDDLTNKPNISGFLEAGDNVSELVNDAGYITSVPVDSVNGQTGIVTIGKADVGLGNVDNTSDLNKPISTATQTALDDKVDKEVGKGLSDENYTNAEKTKLAGIEANANNYVHPNHSGEVTSVGDGATAIQPSAINNKPGHTVTGAEEVLVNDNGALRKTTAQDIANLGGGGGGGEINTASNLGTGEGIFSSKLGSDLRFKSLIGGKDIILSSDPNEITIALDGDLYTSSDFDADFTTKDTDDLPEGTTNLYYTNTRVSANTDVAANTAARHNAVTIGTGNGLTLAGQALSLGLVTTLLPGAMSAVDKSKLDGIEAGAEVNVNADWNAVSSDAEILNKPTLATVATTGAYSDLSGTPALAAVATSGDYDDLSNTPALATVATTGSYNDLSDTPTIPTVPGQKNSIELDTGDLQLVGDDASPGNNKVYGTNGSGVKGWKDDPSGGGGSATFTGLDDTPANYTGAAGRFVKVNSTPDGLEFVNGVDGSEIDDNTVTNAKLSTVATNTLRGRVAAGTGDIENLTATQARNLLNVADGATANTGTVTSVAASGSNGITVGGSPITTSGTLSLGVNAADLRTHLNVADGANDYVHPNHTGEVTSDGDGATTIATNVVTNDKLRQSSALSVIGRSANSTGNVADITAGSDAQVLRRSGTTLGFGTVTSAGIANSAITNAKMANMTANTIKGRITTTGAPQDLTAAQVRTLLNVADGATANAGTVTSVGLTGGNGIEVADSPITTSGDMTLSVNAGTLRSHINVEDGAEVNLDGKNSIEVDTGEYQLVGDASSPGNSKYYGTNSGGTKGFYDLPGGGGGGISWATIAGTTQTMSANSAYITLSTGTTGLTMPTTAAVGDSLRIAGYGGGSGTWIINGLTSGISILFVDTQTSNGDTLNALSAGNSIELICVVEDLVWTVASYTGEFSITSPP